MKKLSKDQLQEKMAKVSTTKADPSELFTDKNAFNKVLESKMELTR